MELWLRWCLFEGRRSLGYTPHAKCDDGLLSGCWLLCKDADATATHISPGDRHPHRPAVHEHRQRVDQGLQQRRLSVLRHALSHVHRPHADLYDMYVCTVIGLARGSRGSQILFYKPVSYSKKRLLFMFDCRKIIIVIFASRRHASAVYAVVVCLSLS